MARFTSHGSKKRNTSVSICGSSADGAKPTRMQRRPTEQSFTGSHHPEVGHLDAALGKQAMASCAVVPSSHVLVGNSNGQTGSGEASTIDTVITLISMQVP